MYKYVRILGTSKDVNKRRKICVSMVAHDHREMRTSMGVNMCGEMRTNKDVNKRRDMGTSMEVNMHAQSVWMGVFFVAGRATTTSGSRGALPHRAEAGARYDTAVATRRATTSRWQRGAGARRLRKESGARYNIQLATGRATTSRGRRGALRERASG